MHVENKRMLTNMCAFQTAVVKSYYYCQILILKKTEKLKVRSKEIKNTPSDLKYVSFRYRHGQQGEILSNNFYKEWHFKERSLQILEVVSMENLITTIIVNLCNFFIY